MKIGGILQARMTSSRLPGKMMMKVLGRPILSYLLERIKKAKLIDCLVLATTENKEDDVIEDFAVKNGLMLFRGPEEDVLKRITEAAREHNVDIVVRLSGDNPIIDPFMIDKVISFYLNHQDEYDYVSNNHPPTYPCGQEVEVLPFQVLEEAEREATAPYQREHGTPFIWEQPGRYRLANVESFHDLYAGEKWDLDYPEDFEFLKKIIEELYPMNKDFDFFDVLRLLEKKPELREINKQHLGDTWVSRRKKDGQQ